MTDPFLSWLSDQDDYWIRDDVVEEQWPDAEFRGMVGITKKIDDEGNTITPRRDLRRHYIVGSVTE